MTCRAINERARGKHLGHACEGHLRGVLHHVAKRFNYTVARALPFEFPVESDAVLLDEQLRIRAIFIVAYWDNARNSDSKFYRTRTEYAEAWRARVQHTAAFSATVQVFTVLYGTREGWKAQVLTDLKTQCPPLLFLPDLLPAHDLEQLIGATFEEYSSQWESGRSDARDAVEQVVAARALNAPERRLARVIAKLLVSTPQSLRPSRALRSRLKVRVPATPVQTRYRQALSVLSVFGEGEVEAWSTRQRVDGALSTAFARRAFFLGLGSFSATKSITGKVVIRFGLRRPFRSDGYYEAHRPDFSSWLTLQRDELAWILEAHRGRTTHPTTVFRGGALDQVVGNVEAISDELTASGSKLLRAASAHDATKVARMLIHASQVSALPSHPASPNSRFLPLWAGVTAATAMAENSRAVRTEFGCRRVDSPSSNEALSLAKRFLRSKSAQSLFSELVAFSTMFRSASLEELAQLTLPGLLQLDEPCSLMADFYNTLTTNPSHNPLNEVLSRWLLLRFPGLAWSGWPGQRGTTPGVAPGRDCRRQWTFVAREKDRVICAEAKSITANNWGNKSKEIFDRVAELRTSCSSNGLDCVTVLMFDGDLSTENLRELASGIAHDEIWTVDEVLADLRGRIFPGGSLDSPKLQQLDASSAASTIRS